MLLYEVPAIRLFSMQSVDVFGLKALWTFLTTRKFYLWLFLLHWIVRNFELLQDRIVCYRCKSSSFSIMLVLKELVDKTIFTFLLSSHGYDLSAHLPVALLFCVILIYLFQELSVLFEI